MKVFFTLGNSNNLTKNTWYDVVEKWQDEYGDWYSVMGDNGREHQSRKRYFLTDQEYRDKKLKELLK